MAAIRDHHITKSKGVLLRASCKLWKEILGCKMKRNETQEETNLKKQITDKNTPEYVSHTAHRTLLKSRTKTTKNKLRLY